MLGVLLNDEKDANNRSLVKIDKFRLPEKFSVFSSRTALVIDDEIVVFESDTIRAFNVITHDFVSASYKYNDLIFSYEPYVIKAHKISDPEHGNGHQLFCFSDKIFFCLKKIIRYVKKKKKMYLWEKINFRETETIRLQDDCKVTGFAFSNEKNESFILLVDKTSTYYLFDCHQKMFVQSLRLNTKENIKDVANMSLFSLTELPPLFTPATEVQEWLDKSGKKDEQEHVLFFLEMDFANDLYFLVACSFSFHFLTERYYDIKLHFTSLPPDNCSLNFFQQQQKFTNTPSSGMALIRDDDVYIVKFVLATDWQHKRFTRYGAALVYSFRQQAWNTAKFLLQEEHFTQVFFVDIPMKCAIYGTIAQLLKEREKNISCEYLGEINLGISEEYANEIIQIFYEYLERVLGKLQCFGLKDVSDIIIEMLDFKMGFLLSEI
ncbi:hypothetical protein RFI_20805 [Reticulomyxa filosa]|uniref:Uncharacterized protein n=1 Tax=Reticulomyxa filosa TaxID=46433 RepID=X6MSV7_RETFI|nr:hypothetical protein RFI_20805 [Reticulomyxa filosa]|eukprot:ETO16532.1 hypothetical protein RFI_20805 [Reticulomyxa filosa]